MKLVVKYNSLKYADYKFVPQKIDMTSKDHDVLFKKCAYNRLIRLNKIIIKASLT